MKKKKQAYYNGEIIRAICPSLYGQPIYSKEGKFIPYKISISKLRLVSAKDLIEATE